MSTPVRDSHAVANVVRAIELLERVSAKRRKAKAIGKLEQRLAAALRKAFQQQERAFLKRFARLRSQFPSGTVEEAAEPDWEALFDDAALATIAAFEGPLQTYLQLALTAGANEVLAILGADIAFDVDHPRAVEYLKDRAAELVAGINDTTKADVRRIVTDGVEQGKSYGEIAKTLRDTYTQYRTPATQQHVRDRAELIAVTEIGNGYESGNRAIVDELSDAGLELEKSWLTAGDDRVSDGCLGNQDAGWIPIGDAFPSGDQQPLRHPGCRCTCLYRRRPDAE